ncbi:hypothetical protein KCTCHS21_01640 [Cohnella abietis]|uniref:Uncharacterized protein n=1 Tax=Cohnella abietis TaxID=2507935 RepID=A0A3T1CYE2_9BACL|nr:hypothetical protein KCTCHS21_01640 [Cohnella abietis]
MIENKLHWTSNTTFFEDKAGLGKVRGHKTVANYAILQLIWSKKTD